ncbi:MAG: hypothetical protein OXN17_12195 [Candidatus Poribacteria bacterium]|nr:hypothetical protein [Candidatus Poribacteria bacterium]MDE0505251.1 hypothetical protein [Candidatus Poribacteria bacterium]
MRITKVLLIYVFTIVVVLGCQSEKKEASTKKSETPQIQETAVVATQEITLSVSNMT